MCSVGKVVKKAAEAGDCTTGSQHCSTGLTAVNPVYTVHSEKSNMMNMGLQSEAVGETDQVGADLLTDISEESNKQFVDEEISDFFNIRDTNQPTTSTQPVMPDEERQKKTKKMKNKKVH